MTSLLARIGALFVEPPEVPQPEAATPRFIPPSAAVASVRSARASQHAPATERNDAPAAPRSPSPTQPEAASDDDRVTMSAAILGAPSLAIPLAAACAGELRTRAKAAAALVCIWRPASPPNPATTESPTSPAGAAAPGAPAGATTPGARRLAARLTAHELTSTGCGRLAWLTLEPAPETAAQEVRRCLRMAGVPVVLAVAGARPPVFEPLVAELDLAVAVLPADADAALHELALSTLHARERAVLPPLPPGPQRWAAMAGLARLRSLPSGAP